MQILKLTKLVPENIKMDYMKTWTDYKSLLAVAKNNNEDAVRQFLDQIRLPTENLTNSISLSRLFALALNFKNFEALEILLKHGVRAIPNQETDNFTVLQYAVVSGNVQFISEILNYGADYDVVDEDGNTLMHLAFKSSSYNWSPVETIENIIQREEAEKLIIDIFDVLISSGLNINTQNHSGETPLSLAVKCKNVKITNYLVERNAELNVFGKSLSHYLILNEVKSSDQPNNVYNQIELSNTNLDFMDWWFSKKLDLDHKYSGMTPLQLCVKHVLKDIFSILITYTDSIDIIDTNGGTLLHTLFSSVYYLSKKEQNQNHMDNCIDIVKILLDKGISVNHVDNNGYTAFHLAAKLDNPKPMQMMLKSFTNVDACDTAKQTPLHFVIKHCNDKYQDQYLLIISSLVTKGAGMDRPDRRGITPLHHACENNTKASKSIIEFFVDQGCNLNVANHKGLTPLHMCLSKDRIELLETLIKFGANVNLRFSDRRFKATALRRATEEQLPKAVELLIKAGANPDQKDEDGNTPLHLDLDIVTSAVTRKLLKMGADPNARNKANWSPLRKALDKGKTVCVKNLLSYGAAVTDIDRTKLGGLNFNNEFGRLLGMKSAKAIVVFHLISLKAAGLPVHADYDRIVQPISESLVALNEERAKELEVLKSTQIDEVGVYDFLHMSLKLRYYYSKRANLKKFMEDYKALMKSFPCYGDIISAKYWTAVNRMPLMESAKNTWYRMTTVCLPEMYVEGVLGYLQNWELRLVIEAGAE